MKCLDGLLLLTTLAGAATARVKLVPPPFGDESLRLRIQEQGSRQASAAATKGSGVFQQMVDHGNASLGTFPQRYYYNSEFWKGPGSPVVLFTPGEEGLDGYEGYASNGTITGMFAQAIGAAVVLFEHRYWGSSSPMDLLTTENLRYLTLDNAIHDATNFARNVQLPFDPSGSSSAPKAPWVLSGGSYSGALTAWVSAVDPGTFWAYHASSAVVETVSDFWEYFDPVRKGMPANCSADVVRVVEAVDNTLLHGSAADILALKTKFGFQDLPHDDDFASAIQNGPWKWQDHDFNSGYSSFFEFCDYVENAVAKVFPPVNSLPGPNGVGLERAMAGYAKWSVEQLIPNNCAATGYWTDPNDVGCFDSYNTSNPLVTDVSLDNLVDRQWMWLLCNEPLKYWQDGAPVGTPTIVSRLVNVAYWERQCAIYFPTQNGYTYGIAEGRTTDMVNAYTGGWDWTNTTRLMWANGEFDPWRGATVSAESRPGGPLQSSAQAPVHLIPGGIHCSDLIASNGRVNAGVGAIQQEEVAIMKAWVAEFYAQNATKTV